jgi:prevent-host-death family protein
MVAGRILSYVSAMDSTVTIEEAEARLAELATRVEQGETIVVTRHGKPVLSLVPHKRKGGIDWEAGRRFKRERGIDKIVTYIPPDFDDPLPEDFLITPEREQDDERRCAGIGARDSVWMSSTLAWSPAEP